MKTMNVSGGRTATCHVNKSPVPLLAILAVGCASQADPTSAPALSANRAALATATATVGEAGGCFDPTQYGGAPDDARDDQAAIQAAIDAAAAQGGGRVCLGPGRWSLSRAPTGSYNPYAALSIHTPRLELAGSGPGTVLEVAGDQLATPLYVVSVDPGASFVTVRDLGIDTSGMTNTSEQTHAVEIGSGAGTGPVEDVRLERIIFQHPPLEQYRKGDCVRLVGNPEPNVVRRVTLIGSTLTSCARSGIAIQRGVYDLVIMGNQFTQAGDQDIDSEPSAEGGNSGLTIVGNVFRDDVTATQDDWAVTLGGFDAPMSAVALSNNVFEGRGVHLYRSGNTVISGNTFNATMESGYGVINFGERAETIAITGNTMRRRGADGPMIRIVHASGYYAQNVTISNNEMVQETLGTGIYAESAVKLTVANNGIEWTRPAPNAYGVYLRATIVEAEATMISGNRIVGSAKYGVYLGASPYAFNTTSVVGNLTTGVTTSLQCDQSVAGNFKQPIVFAANNFNSAPQCPASLVPSRPPG